MKTRTYTITSGAYEDYHIITRITGPATPALSTLYKLFCERFMVERKYNYISGGDIMKHIDRMYASQHLAEADNLPTNEGLAGAFVAWLVRDHGFTTLPSDEFFVDGNN